MNSLVKILTNEDGEAQEPLWHLAISAGGSDTVLCTSEVFGFGEGNATAEEKTSPRRGITCPNCMSIIRYIKGVRI